MTKTAIEWTQYTSNPIRARLRGSNGTSGHYCQKISPGCKNCYASRLQPRFGMPTFDEADLDKVEVFLHEPELHALARRSKPALVFLGDMTDIFGDWVPDEWLYRIFGIAATNQNITLQILTKRAERMREFCSGIRHLWPLPNVWLGVSVENQKYADERIPLLLDTPAAMRFVSAEPLLAPVDLDIWPWLRSHGPRTNIFRPWEQPPPANYLDWVIVGGESGPGARPCDISWIRRIRDDCKAANVPCFVKQLGSRPTLDISPLDPTTARSYQHPKGGDPSEWPADLRVREMPDWAKREAD